MLHIYIYIYIYIYDISHLRVKRQAYLGGIAKCEERQLASSLLCVRMEQLGFHWMDFYEIRRLRIFQKSVEKIKVSLQSDKNNWHFIQRRIYIYDISLTASLNKICLKQ